MKQYSYYKSLDCIPLANAAWLLLNCPQDGNQRGVMAFCSQTACRWLDSHLVAGSIQNRRIAAAWFRLLDGRVCDWRLLQPPYSRNLEALRTANIRLFGAIRAARTIPQNL